MRRLQREYKINWQKQAKQNAYLKEVGFEWRDVPKVVWSFLEKDKKKFVFFNSLLFVVFFYELVPPFIMGRVVDFFTAYHPGIPLREFYFYAIFLGASWAFISLIRLISKNRLTKVGIAVRSRARVQGFGRLMNASLEWHAEENTGNKVQRITTGSQALSEWIKVASGDLYPIVATFTGVSLFFLFTNWTFFVFLSLYNIVFFSIQILFNRKLGNLSMEYDRALEKSSGAYIEGTGNILSIKAIGAEKHVHSQIQSGEDIAKSFQYLLADTGNRKWRFFQIWNGIAYTVFLLLIGNQVINGVISIGSILVLYTYFNKLRESANSTNDISTIVVSLKADLARLVPVFKSSIGVRSGASPFPMNWQKISLKNAEFHYPNKQIGLSDFTLDIPRGARIGVAGTSGGGKSTTIKILLGLYELNKGTFKIDGTDFYEINHEEVMKNMAVVLQETELFNFSLRENITMMREMDKELFDRAIEVADLREVIARLPDGLDTDLGERGYSLSGGERQRVGIARAIYKDAPIILLDEATSALDSQTEKNIVDRLFGEFGRDKTFVIVAHRLSTLRNADELIVVKEGTIVEKGTFEDLLAQKKSELSKLYTLQNK